VRVDSSSTSDSDEEDAESNLSFRDHHPDEDRCCSPTIIGTTKNPSTTTTTTTKKKKTPPMTRQPKRQRQPQPRKRQKTKSLEKQTVQRTYRNNHQKDPKDDAMIHSSRRSSSESSSSSELEVPYAQNFDETQIRLHSELDDVCKEPLRPGDVIVYHHPMFVKEIRVAQVIAIHDNNNSLRDPKNHDSDSNSIPLELSNGECLPADTYIQRIREYRQGTLYPHAGLSRPIQNYKILSMRGRHRRRHRLPESERLSRTELELEREKLLCTTITTTESNPKDDDPDSSSSSPSSASSTSSFLRRKQESLQQLPLEWIRLSTSFQQLHSQIMQTMEHESNQYDPQQQQQSQTVNEPPPLSCLEPPTAKIANASTLDLSSVITRRKKRNQSHSSSRKKQRKSSSSNEPTSSHLHSHNHHSIARRDTTTKKQAPASASEIQKIQSSSLTTSVRKHSMDPSPDPCQDDEADYAKLPRPARKTVPFGGSTNTEEEVDHGTSQDVPSSKRKHPSRHLSHNQYDKKTGKPSFHSLPVLHKSRTTKQMEFEDSDEDDETTSKRRETILRGKNERTSYLKEESDVSSQDASLLLGSPSSAIVVTKYAGNAKTRTPPFAKEDADEDTEDDQLPPSILQTTKQTNRIGKPPWLVAAASKQPRTFSDADCFSSSSRSSKRTIQSFLTSSGVNDENLPADSDNVEKMKQVQVEEFQSIMSQLSNASTRQGSKPLRADGKNLNQPSFRRPMSSSSSSSSPTISRASSAAAQRRSKYNVDRKHRQSPKKYSSSSSSSSEDDLSFFRRMRYSVDPSTAKKQLSTTEDRGYSSIDESAASSRRSNVDPKRQRCNVLANARRPFATRSSSFSKSATVQPYMMTRQLELKPLSRR
jgi:hypothetical protein